jgi:hypothetical protein
LCGFALVHIGEHYVVELVAGLMLATVVNSARRSLKPVAHQLLGFGGISGCLRVRVVVCAADRGG